MWNLICSGRIILQKSPRYCIRKSVSIRGCSSKARDAARILKPGEKVHGYTVQKVTEVPEFFITAVLLQHDRTGTQHLHAAREDDNNAFSVQFRTTPMDSTGVPHILEHTVLCGSQKYPVRDPFFKMLSRSLATFMNALTAYDWTMYPFSTQNLQDYRNLMSVYLDAAFKPLLRELDFCQEGWRLEHEDPKNPSSPLVFKGVVYNEMKGVYSSSHNLFATAAVSKLLPSHTYGVNYGGDPRHIPDLTWQQLKEFHASHYHPSNARFFTYGNFPLAGHLEFIDTYLKDFSKISVNTSVPNEPRWTEPKKHSITCPPDPLAADQSKQTTVAVNFLLSNITDSYEKFVQQIMCQLLTEGEAAPFYSALLASNIGSDYAPITGYQGNTKEGTYAVGLQGILESDVERVIEIIDETLDKVIKEGFDPVRIKAILHTIELGQKHQTSNFGFNLSVGVSSHWNHDGDPVEMIQVNQLVDKFKKDLAKNPKMLQNKVKQYLKENPHRLTLTMSPDPEYMAKQEAEEKERLSKKITSLTEEDRKKIVARGEELLQKQMMKEDLSCLPSLKVTDIDRKVKPETTETNIVGDMIVQSSKQPTNGVTYVRLMTKLPEVDSELLPFVPLFCNVITGIGAAGHDYKWMSQQQELYTGGLSATTHISNHHTDPALLNQALVFSSYCLERNLKKMMDLWNMIFESPDFEDWERLTTLIRMSASDLATSIPQSGHMYALSHAAANLTPAAALLELFGGMTQVSLMKKVAEMQDLSEVVLKLQNIASVILNKNDMRIAVNATAEAMPESLKQIENWIRNMPGTPEYKPIYSEVKPPTEAIVYTHFELPFSVNFVGQAFCAVPYAHPDRPLLTILGALMSRMYLHREIREKGGAYGSGAMAGDGVFTFFSYRDPHSTQTLQTFEKSIEWAAKGSFTDQELELAKISVFQSIDKPVTPGNVGMRLFMDDLSDERRQKFRDRLFRATRDDIIRVTKTYLEPKDIVRGTCLLGPANTALREDKKWTVVKEDNLGQAQNPEQVQTQGATQ